MFSDGGGWQGEHGLVLYSRELTMGGVCVGEEEAV